MPARVNAFVTKVLSRSFGRKTRTGRPDFSNGGGVAIVIGFDFETAGREVFGRGRGERGAVCRAARRGLSFIRAEDSECDLEDTIILRRGRASASFPDAGRPRNQSGGARSLATGRRPRPSEWPG